MITPGRVHDRFLELAAQAIDFSLPPADAAELDRHLASCPSCARIAAALRGDQALVRHPAALLPSRRVDDAVYGAIAGRDPRTSPQRLLVLVAATVLLLVALMGVAAAGAFILRTWQPTVVVPSPSLPVVVVDPSASPAPSIWRVATIPPMFPGGHSTPVAVGAGESGFAAVGGRAFRDRDTPSGGTAGAWHSADGVSWEPAAAGGLVVGDAIPTSGLQPGLVDVAWGPGGFVAVGVVLESAGVVGGVWNSEDGRSWTRSELPDAARARPSAVTWTGAAFVAVGISEEAAAPRGAVWLSADGRSWRRVRDSSVFNVGGYIDTGEYRGWGGPADVTAADGTIYAVGRACDGMTKPNETYSCSPFVIRSVDGETWSTVEVPDASGFAVVLGSVAATRTHVVAVSGGEGEGVVVGDQAGWRQIERRGESPLRRVVAFEDGFLALSTDGNKVSLWTSPDGEGWTAVRGVPQPPGVVIIDAADLAVADGQVDIVGWAEVSSAEGVIGFSIAGSTQLLRQAPRDEPAPSSAAWRPAPSALPVASGTAQLAPGPDGGTYVLTTTANAGIAGRSGRSVLALLDRAGDPRPGWPIAVDGWSCANPYSGAWPPEVASDGSVTVACLSWADGGFSVRMTVSTFDVSGNLVANWWYADEPSGRPRVVDGRLLVIAREVKEQEVTLPDGQVDTRYQTTYWLDEVAGDGTTRRSGERLELGDPGWPVVLGPDGTAYHENMADGEITAFDLDGLRPGWPVRLGGSLSALGFGPDGHVLVTVAAAGATRLVVLGAGGETLATSDAFPMEGISAWSGAGPDGRPMAPLVGADGTSVVIGEAADHTVVYRIDSAGNVLGGWPYRADTAVQWQGTCPAETAGCGVWRAVPAMGQEGTVYLSLAAPDAQIGGSLAGVGPSGKDLAGWPMHLARRGAEFWSVTVGSDGTVFALAVEPEAGGTTSATILAMANDGTVLSRTTVIEP